MIFLFRVEKSKESIDFIINERIAGLKKNTKLDSVLRPNIFSMVRLLNDFKEFSIESFLFISEVDEQNHVILTYEKELEKNITVEVKQIINGKAILISDSLMQALEEIDGSKK